MRKEGWKIVHSDNASSRDLSKDRTLLALHFLLNDLAIKYNIDYEQIFHALSAKESDALPCFVPMEIYTDRPLGVLEATVKFLRVERGMSFNQIAKLLNRDNRTIWSSYHNAIGKSRKRFSPKTKIPVPLDIFSDRKLGLLEALCVYLKDQKNMTYHDIGTALKRNERTIWTSYKHARRKMDE